MIEVSAESIAIISASVTAAVTACAFAIQLFILKRNRPRLHISVRTELNEFGSPATEGLTYVLVTVINRGVTPTSITSLSLIKYRNRIDRVLRIRKSHYTVPLTETIMLRTLEFPFEIGPNQQWTGVIPQSAELVQLIENSNLTIAIGATHTSKQVQSGRVMRNTYGKTA